MNDELRDEIDVLYSIYESSIHVSIGDSETDDTFITYNDKESGRSVMFTIPPGYPHAVKPTFSVSFESRIDPNLKKSILNEIEDVVSSSEGEVVIFPSIERFRELFASEDELIELTSENNSVEGSDSKFIEAIMPNKAREITISVIHGPVTVEQKSSFQAHMAEVHSMEEVNKFKEIVLSDKRVARATHNIFAYRFTCTKGSGVIYHDCDDDGETAAAGRVAEMMRLMGAHDVAVIVSRWFGGVLLGPDRFKFICNSARNLLEENGQGKGGGKKKSGT